MTRYAESTAVPSDRSRAEIEATLRRYGASAFAYGWDDDASTAMVKFRIADRWVAMMLPLPPRDSREFTHTPGRRLQRSPAQVEAAYEQAVRQRWRALALVIKAKLEAVESGISTVEREFLADMLLPDGSRLGDWAKPALEEAYASGLMPARSDLLRLGSGT